ncbi:hypothetical protein C0J52_14465, partial [Blattella germanica]
SEIEKERLQVLAKRTEPPVLDTCPCTCSKKSDVNEEIVPNTHLETEPNMAVPVKSKIPEGYHKLHNIKEADSVSYWVFLTGNIKKYFWVGFHDFYEEGKHVSLFNQSVPTLYNKWWPEYDGRDDYDCVMIYFSCEDHGLLDWKCGDSYPYICEIEDEEGEWFGKVTLDHLREEPLEIYTSRKVFENKCSDQILIVYKKNGNLTS